MKNPSISDLSSIVSDLRAEVETLRSLSTAAKDYEREHKKVLELKRRLADAESRGDMNLEQWWQAVLANGAPIPPDILQSMIRLCHPDRHGNSEAANKATAWLLQQRPKGVA
jgi:hypothetical protein